MEAVIHYTRCPACGSQQVTEVLHAKDYTVSGKTFPIWHCSACSLRFTQDVPGSDGIGEYYKSEEYVSHTNTSRGLINRLYQAVRKITLRQKRKLVTRLTGKKNGDLLDVGSGTGAFVNEMKHGGWVVTGLEPDEGARKVASEAFGCSLNDMSRLFELPENSFDVITLWHVLEHVHDLHNYLERFRSLLKPGGRLIIAVPNYTSFDASVYKEYWAAYDVPRHLYHFSPMAMKGLLKAKGLSLIARNRMWFDSFYVSLLSTRYKYGRSRWLGSIATGFRSNWKALADSSRCSSLIYVAGKDPGGE